MAEVRLSDVIDPVVFRDLPSQMNPEKTALFQSGVVNRNPLLDELANASGSTAELPFWNDLDPDDEPNLSSDNPAEKSTPNKVAQDEQTTRKFLLNNSWSTMNLATDLAMGADAMTHIRSRVDTYWTRRWQRQLLSVSKGVLNANVANDDGDMVLDISGATNADVDANSVFTRQNFTGAAFTMGDAFNTLQAIAVHSVVYKRMVDNNDIEQIRDSEGNLLMETFLGRRVIVDDSMPVVAGSGTGGADTAPKYTSIIFGAGAIGYGLGTATNPVAVDTDESAGNGAGSETLYMREKWILHPFGFKTNGTPAGAPSKPSFTRAEIENSARYSRVIDRKNVPLAFLITNG